MTGRLAHLEGGVRHLVVVHHTVVVVVIVVLEVEAVVVVLTAVKVVVAVVEDGTPFPLHLLTDCPRERETNLPGLHLADLGADS